MIRNPFFDAWAGAFLALGGPMLLLLPPRLMLEMLAPQPVPVPVRREPPRLPPAPR